MGQVQITINGQRIAATAGSTVLEAATAAGIKIPTLCHHPALEPIGACRVCLVEVAHQRALQPACTFPVSEGMEVWTHSPKVEEARRFVLELIISDHPLDCMTCDSAGRCELQDLAYAYGIKESRYPGEQHKYTIDDSNPFIQVDRNKCILCRRCVRVCKEVNGAQAVGLAYRGFHSAISFGLNSTMEDSPCEFCGSCVHVCPVGALLPKKSLGKGRTWEGRRVRTTCPYCGVGCQIELQVKGDQIIGVRGVDDAQPNQGWTCVKGRYGYDFIYSPDRLTTPLIREGDGFREASWDEALDLVVSKFQQIIRESGPDAIAGVSCARSTNEDSYSMQKLFRAVIGTNNIDHCART
ncbi:MAG: molybdopterin-dependent oxidoreductase [Planctomycetes bacterium]|nr:molybdopterin-dependent oxidoreductase [Planctomycetota bacterium]